MEEIWKDIEGYIGDYQVSNIGNVRCMHFGRKKPYSNFGSIRNLKPIKNSAGYYVVQLYKNGRHKQHHIHRLVAEAFIPNPNNYPVIDHINTVTADNRVENLRFCTQKDNVNNPISAKRRVSRVREVCKGKIGKYSHYKKAVEQYTIGGELVKVWECMSDAWRFYGIDSGSMTRACKGERKTAGGYIWKYKQQ